MPHHRRPDQEQRHREPRPKPACAETKPWLTNQRSRLLPACKCVYSTEQFVRKLDRLSPCKSDGSPILPRTWGLLTGSPDILSPASAVLSTFIRINRTPLHSLVFPGTTKLYRHQFALPGVADTSSRAPTDSAEPHTLWTGKSIIATFRSAGTDIAPHCRQPCAAAPLSLLQQRFSSLPAIMATEANGGKAAAATEMQATKPTVTFLELPQETQREIISHVSHSSDTYRRYPQAGRPSCCGGSAVRLGCHIWRDPLQQWHLTDCAASNYLRRWHRLRTSLPHRSDVSNPMIIFHSAPKPT